MMSKVVEKRTVKIPPCQISKDLIRKIGKLLESEKKLGGRITYILRGATRNITSERVDDFVKADWGFVVESISIGTSHGYPIGDFYPAPARAEVGKEELNVTIQMYKQWGKPRFSVSGKDATLIEGLANRLENIFVMHRSGYHRLADGWFLKFLISVVLTILFEYPISIVIGTACAFFGIMDTAIFTGAIVSSGILILISQYSLVNWLFPYFEYGVTTQKKMRKWIWLVLAGSGLIPAVILKIIGL